MSTCAPTRRHAALRRRGTWQTSPRDLAAPSRGTSPHMALRGAGLVVERLGEHREGYWDVMPNLAPELRGRIPLSYSMLARRP